MMNMQDQVSRENLGVKFKERMRVKLRLKLWLEKRLGILQY